MTEKKSLNVFLKRVTVKFDEKSSKCKIYLLKKREIELDEDEDEESELELGKTDNSMSVLKGFQSSNAMSLSR